MELTFNQLGVSNSQVKNVLQTLDGHVILSSAKYPYRFNILDLQHKRHSSSIKVKNGQYSPHDKEWAFGHIMEIAGNIYFSRRPTANRDVEAHSVSGLIYSTLTTYAIFNVDREAKLIDASNVQTIVDSILNLRTQGLIH